jgi:RNA polymerase sigma-70 factor (ECF subfamily)
VITAITVIKAAGRSRRLGDDDHEADGSVSQTGLRRRLVGDTVKREQEPAMGGTPQTAPGDHEERMDEDGRPDPATEAFLAHRNLLFTAAYEMRGSAADAEDVLQESWLRWVGVDLDAVRDPRAYLVQITTRQALSRLRTLSRRKESYVGPWLPEPLDGEIDTVVAVRIDDGLITGLYAVRNPEKLSHIERETVLRR